MPTQLLQNDKWNVLIEEQEKSGLSVSAFCKEQNLKAAYMYSYRHQIKKRKAAAKKTIQEKLMPKQIMSKPDKFGTLSEICLIFSNGLQCVLPNETEIGRIIAEVLSTC